jgi:transcription-repair coupling factor (superfamily II helicase)
MDRLVCGDVGFGKQKLPFVRLLRQLIIANKLRYWFHNNFSVPTLQNFTERLKDMPVSVGYLNRFRTATKADTKIIGRKTRY